MPGACSYPLLQLDIPEADTASASTTATSSWERTPKIEGTMTRYPFLPSMVLRPLPSKKRSVSTTSVLPRHGVLVWNPGHSVGKVPVGELSLSSEEECLSLQAEYSTKVQNMQDDIPALAAGYSSPA